MHRTLSILLCLVAIHLTGCAGLYNQPRHDLSVAAQKAVTDAKLDQLLNEERAQNAKIAEHELAVAENQLLARRNGELISIIDNPNAADARAQLETAVKTRIEELTGGTNAAQALVDLEAAQDAVATREARYRAAGPKSTDPKPHCTTKTLTPSSPLLVHLWNDLQAKCAELSAAQTQLQSFASASAGMIGTTEKEIQAASDLRDAVGSQTKTLTEKYKQKAAELARRRKEALPPDLVDRAKELKDDLDAIELPNEKTLGRFGLAGLKAQLAVDWLDTQRAALATLLQAAASNPTSVPTGVDDELQIAAMLPGIYNELARGLAYPRVTSLVHELNRLGVERDAFQRQVDRANQQIATLENKRDAMQRELVLLTEARAALAASRADCQDLAKVTTFRSAPDTCGEHLRRALHAYADSWTLGRAPATRADWTLTHIDHERALDASEMALRDWNNLLAVQLDALVASYASGLKPEAIGRAIHSLELGAIAVGVP